MTFLKRGQGDAELVGEGTPFQPSGLIAQWSSKILYSFMTQTDPGNLVADGMKPATSRKMGDWFTVFFSTAAEGSEAMHALNIDTGPDGRKRGPQQVWYFECNNSTILNLPPEHLAKFGAVVSKDLKVMSEKSKKYRHELHYVALPKAIWAYSKLNGWEVPDIALDVLTRQYKNEEGTVVDLFVVNGNEYLTKTYGETGDELYAKLCGKPDDAKFDWTSVLGKQRAALWAALGEPNPAKWHSKYNYDAQGNRAGQVEGDNLSTVSDKLDEALGLIIAPWTAWARIVDVADPRIDAVNKNKDNKRLSIPVPWEFFASEAEARKVAEEELKAREERAAAKAGVAATATISQSAPAIPSVWVGQAPKDIVDTLKEFVAKLDGSKPLPLRKKALKENMMFDTMEELDAWLDFAGLVVK